VKICYSFPSFVPTLHNMTHLERSNAELRAALILAGLEIRKLNFGKRDTPLLHKMREVLRAARVEARCSQSVSIAQGVVNEESSLLRYMQE
jgi:hypothetical protein